METNRFDELMDLQRNELVDMIDKLEAKNDELEKKLNVAIRQLNCTYSHTTFGEDFYCTKCGFTKLQKGIL